MRTPTRRTPRPRRTPARRKRATTGARRGAAGTWSAFAALTAEDLLRPVIMAVHADTPLGEVARILTAQGVGGAPVIDDENRLVGVVSLRDLARAAGRDDAATARPVDDFYAAGDRVEERAVRKGAPAGGSRAKRTAEDVMTRRLHSVPLRTPLPQVAARMVERRIHRILVESRGTLAGIVTTTDVLAALARLAPPTGR